MEEFTQELGNKIKSYDKKYISNKKLHLIVVVVFLIVTVLSTLYLTDYLKKVALNNLGESNAKKTSELIFEVMYAKMQDGWTKEEMYVLIDRLNKLKSGININAYRAPAVEELFGPIETDRKVIAKDSELQKALKGESIFIPNLEDNSLRYIYPIKAENECLVCHTNGKAGDVNGILDIRMPASEIEISLDNIIRYFIVFAVAGTIIAFIVFKILIDKIFIKPIEQFTNEIENIEVDYLLTNYTRWHPKTHELYILEVSFNHLMSKINNMLNEVKKKNKLLEEYKKAIDNSTIVSKTDKAGIITYINEHFCKIAGYTQEELLGKPHNIVRSPNMPKEAFEDLWNTIKSKKVWHGVVENRKKNGESYFVQATIMPILDENNEIVEFIGIRQDITELKLAQTRELNQNVKKAIDLSIKDIVERSPFPTVALDKDSNIVYKNRHFKELFTYALDGDIKLEELFIKEEGYLYVEDGIDWKQYVIDFQNEHNIKVLIELDGERYEFSIFISDLNIEDGEYIAYLLPLEFLKGI